MIGVFALCSAVIHPARGSRARANRVQCEPFLFRYGLFVRLSELAQGINAVVQRVEDNQPNDSISRRLRDYGFVNGEPVKLVARGPIGADPLLVQIGYTRFALRRSEAARVIVEQSA